MINQNILKINGAIIFIVLSTITARAQNFHLVKDINAVSSSLPWNSNSLGKQLNFAVVDDRAFFSASDGTGNALWCSNGTADGTFKVSNGIRRPTFITSFGHKAIFTAYDSLHGNEPWISDGTQTNTHVIKDLVPGAFQSGPFGYTIVDDKAFFIGFTNGNYTELWVTDGTDSGTTCVADINMLGTSFTVNYIDNLVSFKGKLYFTTGDLPGNHPRLWSSDGTKAGTKVVCDFKDAFSIHGLVPYGDCLYFDHFSGNGGNQTQLWKTDGTTVGTLPVNANNISFSVIYNTPVCYNGAVYFPATSNLGQELYRYDTTAQIIEMVKDIIPGAPDSWPRNLTVAGQYLYFTTNSDSATHDLWKTDGTAGGTIKIKSLDSLAFMNPALYAFKDKLLFKADSKQYGTEIWISDGTGEETKLVKDINPGIFSSTDYDQVPTALGNVFLFSANDAVHGTELWSTDGTSDGTKLVKDINISQTDGSVYNLNSKTSIQITGDKMLFMARDNHGIEPWITDGTTGGTFILKDINPGSQTSIIYPYFTKFKNKYYFEACRGLYMPSMFVTDGTPNGTTLFQDINTDSVVKDGYWVGSENNITTTSSHLFFFNYENSSGKAYQSAKLYATDGNSPLKVIKPNISHSTYYFPFSKGNYFPVSIDNILYFSAGDGSYRSDELWKSDGTTAGTVMVKDIYPGPQGSLPEHLTVFKKKVFFRAQDYSLNQSLWMSDGTDAGTVPISQGLFQVSSKPFIVSGNWLYFVASNDVHGEELWKTDGTVANTMLVKDIAPGYSGSNISGLTDVSGEMFFIADDGMHGSTLWKTDGTAEGTKMVIDLNAKTGKTGISELALVNGKLFFISNDILWVSQGSPENTYPVHDNAFAGLTELSQLTSLNGQLYFIAYSPQYGYELYTGNADYVLATTLLNFSGGWQNNQNAILQWSIANDATIDHFNLQRSANGRNFINISTIRAKNIVSLKDNYSYTDINAASLGNEKLYYRLQQVDADGSTELSKVISLDISANTVVAITPNPARNTVYVTSNTSIQNASVSLIDNSGRLVITKLMDLSAGIASPLDVTGLSSGLYTLRLQSGNKVLSLKVLISR
ncbi:MAG TPA: ELWxxDGT repeat protein [Parafilimonas sp.]|nr:ELWxxDGT repeat protein [Parafilimonas sp.]